MTTLTFDVSYGTRAVALRLPYLRITRRRIATCLPVRRAQPHAGHALAQRVHARREADLDRALALRAGAGV